MARRWAPGRGWTRLIDTGGTAVWMRRVDDCLHVAVYTCDGFGHRRDERAEAWVVEAMPGSELPYQVLDKPHRIRWVMDMANHDHLVEALVVPRLHARHRRLRRRRHIWRTRLPRSLREQAAKPAALVMLGI